MMTLQPISKVSKIYGVSTRTLRYYEQLGLIKSSKLPDYAYRAYDEEAISRLRQILVLRKLRIPLKPYGQILETQDGSSLYRCSSKIFPASNQSSRHWKQLRIFCTVSSVKLSGCCQRHSPHLCFPSSIL